MSLRPVEHADVRNLDDEAWLERLKGSVTEPAQDGLAYPGFPEEWIQRAFVGSAQEHAIQEAYNFHQFVRGAATRHIRNYRGRRHLDFGCGCGCGCLTSTLGRRAKLRQWLADPGAFWQAVAVVQEVR